MAISPAVYRKDDKGRVRLRGLISGGAVPSVCFTLPWDHRPAWDLTFKIRTANGRGECKITTAGDVWIMKGSGEWFSLDGISFDAAPTA